MAWAIIGYALLGFALLVLFLLIVALLMRWLLQLVTREELNMAISGIRSDMSVDFKRLEEYAHDAEHRRQAETQALNNKLNLLILIDAKRAEMENDPRVVAILSGEKPPAPKG